VLSIALPRRGERPGRSTIKITDSWHAPVGGVMIAASGAVAFAGFPLDDVWHRMFGQDVTLWSPTHLVMVGGGIASLIGVAVLYDEGVRAGWDDIPLAREGRSLIGWIPGAGRLIDLLRADELIAWLHRRGAIDFTIRALISGGLLIGLSMFLLEFDYGVPQFPLVFQPLLAATVGAAALVVARLWAGPGGALVAGLIYAGGRALAVLLVGPVLGEVDSGFPLFLAEALLVELAAVVLARRGGVSPLALGTSAGVLAGTVGFAAEWPWVNAVMPFEWNGALMPEGLLAAAAGGLAGGLLGALLGAGLRGELARVPRARAVAVASTVLLAGLIANGLIHSEPSGVRASVTLTETRAAPDREVLATIRFQPRDVADGASWVRAIAWQGGEPLRGFQLDRISEGVYRTPEPIPVNGTWKSGIRVQNGRSMLAIPIYSPADDAIDAAAIPAPPRFERAMMFDREWLQRERKPDTPGWLWNLGSFSVLVLFLAFASFMAWCIARFSSGGGPGGTRHERAAHAPAAAGEAVPA
jgi:hypothetical protein